MAAKKHLKKIGQGVEVWNHWREKSPELIPDLGFANLSGANLNGANLYKAGIGVADLRWADLTDASLACTDLSAVVLSEANLESANLLNADLSRANLTRATLLHAVLIGTDHRGASLAQSNVYGASVWDILVDNQTNQQNLVITNPRIESVPAIGGRRFFQPAITVDNIEVAQFIYLLLRNQKLRDVIETITSKGVLILGPLLQGAETHS